MKIVPCTIMPMAIQCLILQQLHKMLCQIYALIAKLLLIGLMKTAWKPIQTNSNSSFCHRMPQTCELVTLARHSLDYRHKFGLQNHSHGPTAMIHLRPTSDWAVMFCDRLATDLLHGHDRLELPVWLGKSLLEIKKKFKSDLRPIYNRAERHTRPSNGLRPTCKDFQLRIESLAIET